VLAVLEDPAVRVVRAVLENPVGPAVRAVLENPAVPAAAVLAPVVEQAHVPEVGPIRCRRRSPAAAVAPTVSAVINPQGVVAAVAPSAEEAGRLPTRPAVAAAVAWEVVEVVVVAVTVAEEDAGAKRDERTRNIET